MQPDPDLGPVKDRSFPLHSWCSPHAEDGRDSCAQYRAKVQRYSSMPAEITVQRVGFDAEIDRYRRAAENGRSTVPVGGGRRVAPDVLNPESLQRSVFRTKTRVRKLVTELAPSALVTFTTRETMGLDELLSVWQRFVRLLGQAGVEFEYVCVPERHPSNREHLHLHVAYRGKTPFNTMRRLWHAALEARHGRKVDRVLRGVESPGNIDVQAIKARDQLGRVRKVARYVSKYITKDLIAEFNRKRYWQSKGIDLAAAVVFWLDARTMAGAVLEVATMLGHVDGGVVVQRFWSPSDRVAWCAIDPGATPEPPF